MRRLEAITLNVAALSDDLDALDEVLSSNTLSKERAHILPFFKARKHLCAALGLCNSSVAMTDRVATELALFGDFVCDVASGDSQNKAYTLVEFEDATLYSVFSARRRGRTTRSWSPRFERGFSQLVDWAWRLSTEGTASTAFRRVFEGSDPVIHMLLVIGRDADLSDDDIARLRWRANNISLGAFRMSCLTFDGVLNTLRRRLLLTAQPDGND